MPAPENPLGAKHWTHNTLNLEQKQPQNPRDCQLRHADLLENL